MLQLCVCNNKNAHTTIAANYGKTYACHGCGYNALNPNGIMLVFGDIQHSDATYRLKSQDTIGLILTIVLENIAVL